MCGGRPPAPPAGDEGPTPPGHTHPLLHTQLKLPKTHVLLSAFVLWTVCLAWHEGLVTGTAERTAELMKKHCVIQ